MISNSELKPLRIYRKLKQQLELREKFDKYSIIKHLPELISKSNRECLFRDLKYKQDEMDRWLTLIEHLEVLTVDDDYLSIGNRSAKITFSLDSDDELMYLGYTITEYGRKLC